MRRFIWDHVQSRPHSFDTIFIWEHIHLRSHSFYAKLKWSGLIYCEQHFYDVPSTYLRKTWNFARDIFILTFTRLNRSCPKWFALGCKCTRTLKHRRGQKTPHTWGLEGSVAPLKCHFSRPSKELHVLRSCSFRITRFAFLLVSCIHVLRSCSFRSFPGAAIATVFCLGYKPTKAVLK